MEKNEKKSDRTIIKCKDCGFKYYDGNIHKCPGVSVKEKPKEEEEVGVEEKPSTQGGFAPGGKEKKETTKTRKESFKIWKDS